MILITAKEADTERSKGLAAQVQHSIQQLAQVTKNLMPEIRGAVLDIGSDFQNESSPGFSK